MNVRTHPVAPADVMALADSELSPDRVHSVTMHLNGCYQCAATARALRETSGSLVKWTVPTLPTPPEDRILKELTNVNHPPDGGLPVGRRTFRRQRPALAWGAAVVAALFIFMSLNFNRARRMAPRAEKAVQNLDFYEDREPSAAPVTTSRLLDRDSAKLAEKGMREVSVTLQSPMIAHTVLVSVVVKEFDAGRAALDSTLARHHGYVASLSITTPQGTARTLEASLRIPAPELEAALGELKSLGRVERETQRGEEVTQQYADVVARIKNDRETELRLQDILRTRTGKVKDVLEVEQEIARVRGEIEQMEAEQKTLEHRVEFATIDLKLAEEYKVQLNAPSPSVLMQPVTRASTAFAMRSRVSWP